jgi:hypothetical protein
VCINNQWKLHKFGNCAQICVNNLIHVQIMDNISKLRKKFLISFHYFTPYKCNRWTSSDMCYSTINHRLIQSDRFIPFPSQTNSYQIYIIILPRLHFFWSEVSITESYCTHSNKIMSFLSFLWKFSGIKLSVEYKADFIWLLLDS